MFGALLHLCFLVWAAWSQPAFPPGIDDVMSGMDNDTSKVDVQNADERDVLNTLKNHASKSLEADLLESLVGAGMSQAAYVAARARLLKLIYVGGCPRDMSARCPSKWSESAGNTCSPPDDYDGRCSAVAVTDLDTVNRKEEFSWKCHAEWPCHASCKREFATCPQAWRSVGRLCVAPGVYDGICSPVMDFESYSVDDKTHFSLMCNVAWPCRDQIQDNAVSERDMNGPIVDASTAPA